MPHRDMIVIGASQGGQEPLLELVQQFEADLPASVFIVRHISKGATNFLVDILARVSQLEVVSAEHCQEIRKGTIYIAPADCHLLINSTHTYLSSGPRENLSRPAIDPLFRSAAVACGARVTGVILSGELDDGTAGLIAIKKCGGLAIVQHPETAASSSMPQSAADSCDIDFFLPPGEIGQMLNSLVREKVEEPGEGDELYKTELSVLTGTTEGIEEMAGKGALIPVGCPSCGGPLWQVDDGAKRFRCHTGHAFGERSLLDGLAQSEEQALYAALRSMEERVRMLEHLSGSREKNPFDDRLEEARKHAADLRGLLHSQEKEQWSC